MADTTPLTLPLALLQMFSIVHSLWQFNIKYFSLERFSYFVFRPVNKDGTCEVVLNTCGCLSSLLCC